jgi:hypothetical protein
VIAHLVLFKPKPALSDADRHRFLIAFEHALVSIPTIARARVGQRRRLGRQYDQQSAADFPYAAILEFKDEAGLRAYLEHPAHQSLGEQFYTASESALALDFDLIEGDRVRELDLHGDR